MGRWHVWDCSCLLNNTSKVRFLGDPLWSFLMLDTVWVSISTKMGQLMQKTVDVDFSGLEIPPRTCMIMEVPKSVKDELAAQVIAVPDGGVTTFDVSKLQKHYRCVDCEWETDHVEMMMGHQEHPNHTWWQTLRKFFGGSAISPGFKPGNIESSIPIEP
jgi:hypothetical protein